jgi:hypothetical protein
LQVRFAFFIFFFIVYFLKYKNHYWVIADCKKLRFRGVWGLNANNSIRNSHLLVFLHFHTSYLRWERRREGEEPFNFSSVHAKRNNKHRALHKRDTKTKVRICWLVKVFLLKTRTLTVHVLLQLNSLCKNTYICF